MACEDIPQRFAVKMERFDKFLGRISCELGYDSGFEVFAASIDVIIEEIG